MSLVPGKEDFKKNITKQLEGIIANCTVEEMRSVDHMKMLNQDMRA